MTGITTVSLWVYTDSYDHDDEIVEAVGRETDGSGYDYNTNERDLSFSFGISEMDELGAVVVRLSRLPFVDRASVLYPGERP